MSAMLASTLLAVLAAAAAAALALPTEPAELTALAALAEAELHKEESAVVPEEELPDDEPKQVLAEPADANDTLPDFFPRGPSGCRRNGAGRAMSSCIRNNLLGLLPHIKDGGHLGLPNLDPYFVPTVNVNFKSSVTNFHAITSNVKIEGFGKVQVFDARADLKDDVMNMDIDILFPKMSFSGLFEFTNGFFSQWTYRGSGPFEFVFRNVNATWRFQGKKEPGSKYMTITKASPVYTVGGMKFWARNLVEGFPALDDIIINSVNRLWADLVRVGKPAVQKPMGDHIRKEANAVFLRVPYDEIFPPA